MTFSIRLLPIGCLLLASIGLGLPPFAQAAPDDKILRFNVSPDGYPPFTIVRDDGTYGGIFWDTLTIVAARHGYSVKGMEIPRKRVDDFLLQGRLDVTPRAIEWTDQPERFVFTEPLLNVQEVFFKRADRAFEYTGPDSITDKTVVTHLGYEYPALDILFALGAAGRFDVQHESDMLHHLLAAEHFDLAIAVLQVGLWHIRQQGWQDKLDYAPQPLSEQGYRLMFSKANADFVAVFNSELQQLKASGEMKRILDRYR